MQLALTQLNPDTQHSIISIVSQSLCFAFDGVSSLAVMLMILFCLVLSSEISESLITRNFLKS